LHDLANDVGLSVKSPLPEFVLQEYNFTDAFAIVLRKEIAADEWFDSSGLRRK
jgi:hypothetical protein